VSSPDFLCAIESNIRTYTEFHRVPIAIGTQRFTEEKPIMILI
jgi:hypothetical protein